MLTHVAIRYRQNIVIYCSTKGARNEPNFLSEFVNVVSELHPLIASELATRAWYDEHRDRIELEKVPSSTTICSTPFV